MDIVEFEKYLNNIIELAGMALRHLKSQPIPLEDLNVTITELEEDTERLVTRFRKDPEIAKLWAETEGYDE